MSIPIPETLDDITPDWLTRALTGAGVLSDGQQVVGVRRDRGAGGIAVTGSVARFHMQIVPDPAGAPASLFAKVPNPRWEGGPEGYALEVRFYRDLASQVDLPVPRCYHADFDPETGRFVLLLEDLSDVRPGHPKAGCDEPQAAQLMRDLARLHGAWWESQVLMEMEWPRLTFDAERARYWIGRFRTGWDGFLADDRYHTPDDVREAIARVTDEMVIGARERLGGPPYTLIHSDLHVENMLLDRREDGLHLWVFDWQDPQLGNPAWDYAYSLASNVTVRVQRAATRRLLELYHAELTRWPGVEYPFDQVLADYRASAIWNGLTQVVFLTGTYQPENDEELRTLQMEWDRVGYAFARAV